MRVQRFDAGILLIVATMSAVVFSQRKSAPETFTANLRALGDQGGSGSATIQINVRRYTPEADRTAVETALKSGGYRAFLDALRKAPEVGSVVFNGQTWAIRWARERPATNGRTIALVTDQPIHFVGGGATTPKPRTGYEVALIQIRMDDGGFGTGTMAAAARVRPGGDTGVLVDDYAARPIQLVSVVRKIE